MNPSLPPLHRRDLLKWSGALAATGLTQVPSLAKIAFGQEALPSKDPHFLFHLHINEGIDSSYFFDARPPTFKEAGLVSNYHKSPPIQWEHKEGNVLAGASCKPLAAYKDYFSVIRGIHVTSKFDGHAECVRKLYTGGLFSGDLYLQDTALENFPIPYILLDTSFLESSAEGSGALVLSSLKTLKGLINTASKKAKQDETSQLLRSIIQSDHQRVLAGYDKSGLFHKGSALLQKHFTHMVTLEKAIGQIQLPEEKDRFLSSVKTLFATMTAGVSNACSMSLHYQNIDSHAYNRAQKAPDDYDQVGHQIAQLFQYLSETPLSNSPHETKNLIDATTVLITTEFSRTSRQLGLAIDKTGTDHNPVGAFALLGGKGIRSGQVIGATDLDQLTEKKEFAPVSKAHLKYDAIKVKPMGKPFDFKNNTVLSDKLPAEYNPTDYITIESVINTVYSVMGVSRENWRKIELNTATSVEAPVLTGVL